MSRPKTSPASNPSPYSPKNPRNHRPSAETDGLPILYTSDQTAAYLGLDPTTLCDFRRRGLGPRFVRYGHKIRYRSDDIVAWLDSHSMTASA